MADKDGDGLPDAYEIETYGSTNIVGTSLNSDTDGDGASDVAEYVAGTSATNSNSKFKIYGVIAAFAVLIVIILCLVLFG